MGVSGDTNQNLLLMARIPTPVGGRHAIGGAGAVALRGQNSISSSVAALVAADSSAAES
jgi:hypothetical protein